MGLFSKLKDYNLELEEILDNKYFSSNIKSLLLSMIYKLEISYNDFQKVKKSVRSKEDFLNEIVEIIRLYCDNIKTVEPDSSQAKLLIKNNVRAVTNERERSILTYPTEIALLYAISDISPKYFYIDANFPLKNLLQNSLVNGYNLNNVEILRDFNGWSWDQTYEKNFKFIDNLIYQNLLVILGEKFLYEWRTYGSTRRDFLDEAKKYIKFFTGNDKYIKTLYKIVYLNSNEKDKKHIDEILKEKRKKLKKMEDKITFINEHQERKKKLNKKLQRIDIALNDKKALEKEFQKANSKLEEKKKIKSILKYKKMLEKEREKYLLEISEIDYILIPSNFLKEKKMIEEILDFYKCKEGFENALTEWQKEFLHFLEKKLSKMKTRDEIINILYEIRYYKRLKISEDIKIADIEDLNDLIDKIQKKAITMLCKLGAIKIISMDINLNFEIIKYALDTKIMELEEIKLVLKKEEEGLIIKVFDKDVFEKQGRKKMKITNKTLEVRENRKIKLFN